MAFRNLTNSGKEYLATRLANELPVKFIKAKIGNGSVPLLTNPANTTDLYNFKKQVTILNAVQEQNSIKLTLQITNDGINEGFYLKEIGIYVDDNGKEVLYWYCNEDNSQYINAQSDIPIVFEIDIMMEVTNINSTIVEWTGKDTWISKTHFDEKVRTFEIPTIAELQSRKNLKVGDIVEVLGYYTAGDGAGHKRIIANEDDGSGVQLNNKLWANIVHNGEVNVSWFGCKYNSLESARANYTNLLKAINYNQTINITVDLYIEQNGDNVVTSENLILKGKDKAKLILCTNFENLNWFLINKNLKNLSFTDLEVKFNATTERVSVLFAINGMIKVNNCNIEKCVFNINTNGRLMYWTNVNTNIKPDLLVHGFDVFNIKNNVFNNILNSLIVISDVIYREFNVINNKINNFYYTFISAGTTNETTFENENINNKIITNICDNIIINDDSFILNEGTETDYYCFVLFEANVINYKNNYIEGIKSQDVAALYDSYFGGNYLYYENNTWKNNLCFNINKVDADLLKSKSVKNKYYRNNTYIIEDDWLNKFNVAEEARWIYLDRQNIIPDNVVIENNYIDVYELKFHGSTPWVTNYSFLNNNLKMKKSEGHPLIYGTENEKTLNCDYIIKDNVFDLGEIHSSDIIATLNENFYYRKIIIDNNIFYFSIDKSINYFYVLSNSFFANNVQFNNNKFIQTKDFGKELAIFNRYKKINSNKFEGINNVFSVKQKNDETYTFMICDLIPRKKTEIKFRHINTLSGIIKGMFFGTFDDRLNISDIPKISYRIKMSLKEKTKIDKVYYLFFSLEKINNKENIEFYNSLGQLEKKEIDISATPPDHLNFYLVDEKDNSKKEFLTVAVGNNTLAFHSNSFTDKSYDELEFEFIIIGG